MEKQSCSLTHPDRGPPEPDKREKTIRLGVGAWLRLLRGEQAVAGLIIAFPAETWRHEVCRLRAAIRAEEAEHADRGGGREHGPHGVAGARCRGIWTIMRAGGIQPASAWAWPRLGRTRTDGRTTHARETERRAKPAGTTRRATGRRARCAGITQVHNPSRRRRRHHLRLSTVLSWHRFRQRQNKNRRHLLHLDACSLTRDCWCRCEVAVVALSTHAAS